MAYWTTEEVAEHLGISVMKVYESRRRREFPGKVGKMRGRRLMYPSDLILAGPQEPKTTSDPIEAILWTVQGIEAKLADILKELRRQPPWITGELLTTIEETTTIEIEEE